MSVAKTANDKTELICDEMSQRIIETAEHIVTVSGADSLTVRKLLQTLGITNRVFYNRFRNIGDVLKIVYKNTVLKIRASVTTEFNSEADFFDKVTELVIGTLLSSYDKKMQFNSYVFENDSLSQSNYEWWTTEIKKLIVHAKENGYIKDVDADIMSYSIWCFCRGFNADAVGRKLPREDAVRQFRYSFGILMDGLRK
ncbi:MAG: TetR/AcrR family transcriptional regulator [Clostridia bacterium]|nr:TetR/AcrR family transcriptional regulator [Clostridia bacterium]